MTSEANNLLWIGGQDQEEDAGEFQREMEAAGPSEFSPHLALGYDQARARLQDSKFGIIVLSLKAGDPQAVDLALRVQADAPGIPVVALFDSREEKLMSRVIRSGAQEAMLLDEARGPRLLRVLRHAVERHRFRKELFFLTDKYRRANEQLKEQVRVDPLTGLLNRRGLQEMLLWERKRSRRAPMEYAVMMLDVDDFKRVNDRWGHTMGDALLKELGQRLKAGLRESDYAARVGGDEFLLLLPQAGLEEGQRVAERVRLEVANARFGYPLAQLRMTVSLGLEIILPRSFSVEELVARARLALERSKRQGKNQVSTQMTRGADERGGEMLSGVLEALCEGDRFRVVKQPICRLRDGQRVGFELLSRLAVAGFESPADFFNLSEAANILTTVDRQCFSACMQESSRLPEQSLFHLNVFPSTLAKVPTEELLEAFPEGRGKDSYCLEISEQQILGGPGDLLEPVRTLKQAGVLVGLDGVGCGRSALENLFLLEPDVIKVDRALVKGISRSAEQQKMVQKLIKVSKALSAEVLAEGVENKQDLALDRNLGVQYGQGYFWGVPA